jgi:hypothetical protein
MRRPPGARTVSPLDGQGRQKRRQAMSAGLDQALRHADTQAFIDKPEKLRVVVLRRCRPTGGRRFSCVDRKENGWLMTCRVWRQHIAVRWGWPGPSVDGPTAPASANAKPSCSRARERPGPDLGPAAPEAVHEAAAEEVAAAAWYRAVVRAALH